MAVIRIAWPFVAADVTGLYIVCLLFSFEVGSVCGASDMTPIELDAGGGGCVFGSGGAEELANDESLLTLFPSPVEGVFPALFPEGPLPLLPG